MQIIKHFFLLWVLLFFPPLVSSTSARGRPRYNGKKWCKIPEEYCVAKDETADMVCYMPLGMRCERSGEIMDITETIMETVTVTIPYEEMMETEVRRYGLQKEYGAMKTPVDEEEGINKTKRGLYEAAENEYLNVQHQDKGEEHGAPAVSFTSDFDFRAYMQDFPTAKPSATAKPEVEDDHKLNYGDSMVPHILYKRDLETEIFNKDHLQETASAQNFARQSPKTIWSEKPVMEVSCVVRPRLLWDDFKITWGPAWKDVTGCNRLFHAMGKRGLVTGYKCGQFADTLTNSFYMEARGHRPRFPKSLVADAIRETFAADNTLYYRGYENSLLCERGASGWFEKKL